METLLEQQRRYHEERERLMDSMTKEMLQPAKPGRDHINKDHRTRNLLDVSRLRKEEVQALYGPNEFQEFYSRLKQLKDFHRKHPNEISVPMSMEFDEINKMRENADDNTNMVEFSDEEGYGKYLDLHECHTHFINLKGMEKIDYISYLSTFDHLFDVPKERKNAAYKEYLQYLLEYLEMYVQRIKPILDINKEMRTVLAEFEQQFSEGHFPGWPKETLGALAHTGAHLDLSAFSSWEELASLGLDRLKSALMALGLKCGGTLEERAQRLFSTKGKRLEDLDPAMFAKSKPGRAGKARESEKQREIAGLEAQVYRFSELLSEQRAATRENVIRKQARTGEEREESDDEDTMADSDDDDDDVPYNPKNLPLGWDGKPIPYWLYKLHGLNISYQCEICCNVIYKGPKAFQRHFAGGICCNVIKKGRMASQKLCHDYICNISTTHEEFEDSIGNVVNKKTYEDMKRQGLL
ncbi:SF3A3-like protein [Mya arenaria]|uniref:SF3A3-like protein n=1 Tax=Mya arenaria TaxID=6604 RepID=A0ABY7EL30_MYAAR|nr:SF3A3-like protein [Mya arenaria]